MDSILPLFPSNELILPGVRRSLQVKGEVYQRLIHNCVEKRLEIGAIPSHRDLSALLSFREHIYGVTFSVTGVEQQGSALYVEVLGAWKFESSQLRVSKKGVLVAAARRLPEEGLTPIPPDFQWLINIWRHLRQHESVASFQSAEPRNSRDLGWLLTLVLPISIHDQMYLLSMDYPNFRLKQLSELVKRLLDHFGTDPGAWSLSPESRTLTPLLAPHQP